jgi:hypothetical protein
MKTPGIASFLFFLASAGASAWVPAECPGNPPKQWALFEEKVRKAIPSSTIYVPRPFPVKEADILEDLKHQYMRVWKTTNRADIPKEELPLLEGLEKGTLRYQVEKVVNWTPTRCLSDRPSQFYHLVRIYRQDGEEITRYVLNKSGLWSALQHAPQEVDLREKWKQELPTLQAALAEVKSRYGLQGASGQYVSTVAGTVRCATVQPCIAFQAGGKMYLLDKAPWGGLYEFTSSSPGLSAEEIKGRARRGPGATAEGVDIKATGLLSVGNRWVYARRVAPR